MAKTETFTQACSKVGNFSYYNNFTLYVQLTNRDGSSATNKSWVDYKVYCSSNGSGSLDSKHAIYFSINGSEKVNTTVNWKATSPYISITIAEGSIQVDHNPDGNKTISYSASIKANSYGVSASKSGDFALEKIPRYTTVTNSTRGRTINTISVNWSTTDARDHTQYSLNGGTWTDAGDTVSSDNKSGYYTISNLSANTKYTVKTRCKRADSQLWSEASTLTITTYDIARLTEAPNINIGSSHTIKWTNPAGATTSLKLCKTDGTQVISYGTVTGTSKSVTPTANTIYALTPNSNTITLRYILTTTQNSKSYTSSKDVVFSVTNSNPTFSNFTYQDTSSVVTLTGNTQTIVKGYSEVQGIITTANKAVAKNSATMSKYRLSIGDKTAEVAYSSTADKAVKISAVQSNSFTMYAIDSRGNSTGKTITAATYINYSPIKITSISLIRTNSVTSETTLKFSGNIWNGNFGLTDNAITSCSYRYKKTTDSSWTTGATTITPTKSGGTFSFTGIIKGDLGANGFDIDNSYNIQVLIADKLSNNHSNPASFTLGPGTPAMAIYKNNVAIGQRYSTSEGGKLQVNGQSLLKGRVLLKHSPPNFGGCRENTVVDSYVKLFTHTMSSQWKTAAIWFTLVDTQSNNENMLCCVYIYKGETNTTISGFNYVSTKGEMDSSRLVAIVTGNNTVEVYFKMKTSDSPTISILSHTKMFEDNDGYGKITIDCKTTTTSLPSGTATSALPFIRGQNIPARLEAIQGRITNANIAHSYQNSRAHMQLAISTSSMTSNKPANDGYILHFSWDNSGEYNSQLFLGNGTGINGKVQVRNCSAGTWSSWETLNRMKVLYDNSSGTTGTVTLSETAANFNYLEIFFKSRYEQFSSVRIVNPNNRTANLHTWHVFASSSGTAVGMSRNVNIAGTTLSTGTSDQYGEWWSYQNQVLNQNNIWIYKVVGYR